jgi:hypothetical protein
MGCGRPRDKPMLSRGAVRCRHGFQKQITASGCFCTPLNFGCAHGSTLALLIRTRCLASGLCVKAWFLKTALPTRVASTVVGCGGGDSETAVGAAPVELASLVTQVESYQPPQSGPLVLRSRVPLARGSRPDPAKIRLPRLDAPDPSTVAAVPGRPLQIGHARAVPATSDAQRTHGLLQFLPGAAGDGPTAAVSFSSPGAASTRLGLRIEALPADTRVRGYTGHGDTLFELSGGMRCWSPSPT